MSPQRFITFVDKLQQRHRWLSFPFAVVKKYGDDSGGYEAALITYYSFWSLFPLLLVLVTILQFLFHNDPQLKAQVLQSVSNYFPQLGNQLQQNVHASRQTGVGLAVGLLLTAYGARGAADAVRFTLNNIWQVPKNARSGFPKSMLQSFGIMATIALGLVATVAVSTFSSSLAHAFLTKAFANLAGFIVTVCVLITVFRVGTSRTIPIRDMLPGATIAAAVIQMLLTFGSILVANELRHLDSLYGTFALVLGLLFWLYLLAQVVVYAAEIDSVRYFRLWPRAIDGNSPTKADQRAYELYARAERYGHAEKISVHFRQSTKNDV